jgi:hypothetical protein
VKSHHVPHERVLRVSYDTTDATLYVAYLKTPKQGKSPALVVLNGVVQNSEKDEVEAWAQAAMDTVYKGTHRITLSATWRSNSSQRKASNLSVAFLSL